ncbi:hypothetical protein VW41_13650 [Klebsiella michiganensis]|nr:hypothetical protein VW41_13650 [Klebsiella michiganensis]
MILHLKGGEPGFVKQLTARVDIEGYARKIKTHAHCFEAWEQDTLIGLVAAYLNAELRFGYITNVSVLPGFQSRGIANLLLNKCINQFGISGINTLELEVYKDNERAQRLYLTHGFVVKNSESDFLKMVRCGVE